MTETFDWSKSPVARVLELLGYPEKHPIAMEKTLERLEGVVTGGDAD